MIQNLIQKYNNYKAYNPKTTLGAFIQAFLTNKWFAILVSMIVTATTALILEILHVDYETILLAISITALPMLIYIVVAIVYVFFVLPIKWLISKIKK